MVENAKKLAKKLGAKLRRERESSDPSRIFALGTIVNHIKRNWVEVKTKTLKISGFQAPEV